MRLFKRQGSDQGPQLVSATPLSQDQALEENLQAKEASNAAQANAGDKGESSSSVLARKSKQMLTLPINFA